MGTQSLETSCEGSRTVSTLGRQSSSNVYLEFFGIKRHPFAMPPDPRFFLQSRSHLEALASLMYGIKERKGFILLTGQVGVGKTTVLRTLLENIDPSIIFSNIINTNVNFVELLQMICNDFVIPTAERGKVELIDGLFDFLVDSRLQGKTALVVIDEAQNLSEEVLESLRMLSNLETPRDKLLQIILCGQPELKAKLMQGSLRQLAQRIVVNSVIDPLQPRECERYIYHRLHLCGAKGAEIFPSAITAKIARLSRGVPRLINIVCDNCLLVSHSEGKRVVDEDVLAQAADKCLALSDNGRKISGIQFRKNVFKEFLRRIAPVAARVAVLLIIILLVIITGLIANSNNPTPAPKPASESKIKGIESNLEDKTNGSKPGFQAVPPVSANSADESEASGNRTNPKAKKQSAE